VTKTITGQVKFTFIHFDRLIGGAGVRTIGGRYALPSSSIASGGGLGSHQVLELAAEFVGEMRAVAASFANSWDPRSRRGAGGSCIGARFAYRVEETSTRRMRVRPVWAVDHLCERHRHEMASLDRIIARCRGQQVLRRAIAKVARVLHVERNRIGAAQLVADVLRGGGSP